MGFFIDPSIPCDNNQAERDIRMMEVREKISGSSRNGDYGRAFCNIGGVISGARKQSRSMLESLTRLLFKLLALGKDLAEGQGS